VDTIWLLAKQNCIKNQQYDHDNRTTELKIPGGVNLISAESKERKMSAILELYYSAKSSTLTRKTLTRCIDEVLEEHSISMHN